jgi:hypothetical protein
MRRSINIWVLALALVAIQAGWAAPHSRAQGLAQIASPRDRAGVRGLVPIEGSATHPQFQKYEVHYASEPNPGDQWTPVGNSPFSVPVVQGRLALWDTTVISDGLYSLRLRVVRLDGNYEEYFVRGIQVNNTRPIATPTTAVTATRPGPTVVPTATPTVVIAVPTVLSPTPQPTDTPLPTDTPMVTPEPMDLPFQNVSDAACWGVGATVALFVGIGLLFALKGGLAALVRWLTRHGRESLGLFDE